MRHFGFVFVLVGVVVALAACTSPPSPNGGGASPTPQPTALPDVAPVRAGSLPSWITEISPKGEAADGAQIRVRFANEVAPLEALDASGTTDVLSHVTIEPDIPGHFVLLTPKMIGFEADAPIPHASRVKIVLHSGLADLKGHTLDADYAWTFTTQPIALSGLPGSDSTNGDGLEPQSLTPTIPVTADAPVDVDSLVAHAHLVPKGVVGGLRPDLNGGNASPIPLIVKPSPTGSPDAQDTPNPEAAPGQNAPDQSQTYSLVPQTALARDTTYAIVIDAGVKPLQGNLPIAKAANGFVRTYGDFKFGGVSAVEKPLGTDTTAIFTSGTPELDFSNGLDASTVIKSVTISPSPPPGVTALAASDGSTAIAINSVALKPNTTYTFAIAPTLKDRFGQALAAGTSATFTTGDAVGNIWAPSGLTIFPSGPDLRLNISTTNLPDRSYHFASHVLAPLDLIDNDLSNADATTFLSATPWPATPATGAKNVESTTPISLRALLGGPTGVLAYAASAREFQYRDDHDKLVWSEPTYAGFAELTNLGVFAQWFPSGGIVRVHHLTDGMPVAGARVEVYQSLSNVSADTRKSLESAARIPCATGTTGAAGSWQLDNAAFTKCASTATDDEAPALLAIVHEGSDWAWTRTDSYSGANFDDVYAGWSAGRPQSHGTVVTDRTLYQPGESLRATAVAYFDENGALVRGRSASYSVTISDPDGKSSDLGSHALDRFGSLSLSYVIPKTAKLGYYTITLNGGSGEQLDGSFRVAEFRPPTFSVALSLPSEFAAAGTSVAANVKSTYLFGAPVEGATTHVSVTRAQTNVNPKGWDAFQFGRSWDWPDQPPSISPEVAEMDVKTASDGTITANVPVADDLPYPMSYTVDANTTDVANLSVADTKSFTALPSTSLIGIKSDFVAEAGTAFPVSAIVSDPNGATITGKTVHIVLQRRDDISAAQLDEGSEVQRQDVHYEDVASVDASPGDKAADVSLTAPKPGSYRIVANFPDAKGPATETDRFLWVSGAGETNWFARDPNHLTIKLDKAKYRPGDTANALIQSPYDDAEVFLAVIRHGVLFQTTRVVLGAAPQISFKVTPDMLPNAAVEAVVVRRGTSLAKGVPAGLGKLAKVGMEPFEVALDAKYLKLAISPQTPRVLPGGAQHVSFDVHDAAGKPASGEIVVAVVNDAILQLTGYRYPDLTSIVYADQPISERLADNRFLVQLATQAKFVDKGFGYGGGALAGAGSTRVRTKFQPLAYYNGAVAVGPDGKASVDFTLPDDLTTWRVMAMALTSDARFGTADNTFIASKPLVTEPILPQFARPGDRFSAGVAVTDIAKTGGDVKIAGTLGGALGFGDPSKPDANASLQAPINALTAAYRFDVAVNGTDTSTVKFSTALGSNTDAFQVSLPIRTNDVLEDVVETGTTTTQANVPLTIDSALPDRIGGLTVSLASTLLPEAFAVVNRLHEDPYPFATSIASRLAIASDALVLDRLYSKPAEIPALNKTIAADLVNLRALDLGDGGFADYPQAKESELYSTAFVATQLEQVKLAGINVDDEIARVKGYLGKQLADPGDTCPGKPPSAQCLAEARLEALETLGTLGDIRADHLDEIMAQNTSFSFYERIELAKHLIAVPAWHDQGIALRDKLFEQLYETGRRASINDTKYDWESPVSGQGQVIGLMLVSKVPPDRIDRAFTTLLQLRKNGSWGCLCDDAEAFNAVTAYAKSQGAPPDFSASAKLSSLVAASGTFHGYAQTSVVKTVAMHALPRGSQTVALTKTGSGTLHYAVDFSYGIAGDEPGRYQGIRIDRKIRNAGSPDVLDAFGLGKPIPPTLDPGRVYEIEDRITTDHPLDDVIVTDPIPAGLEAVDATLRTSSAAYVANSDSWQIDYQQLYRDRVLSYAGHLEAGTYALHYLVRSVTPGTFAWPAAQVSLQYAPDEFGRTSQTTLTISPLK